MIRFSCPTIYLTIFNSPKFLTRREPLFYEVEDGGAGFLFRILERAESFLPFSLSKRLNDFRREVRSKKLLGVGHVWLEQSLLLLKNFLFRYFDFGDAIAVWAVGMKLSNLLS